MYTLCIRYTLDPNKIRAFRTYVENESDVIRNAGGAIIGYFLPTDFAGPTNVAYGLIDFDSLGAYEAYRKALADDSTHKRNVDDLEGAAAVIMMERSIVSRCDARSAG